MMLYKQLLISFIGKVNFLKIEDEKCRKILNLLQGFYNVAGRYYFAVHYLGIYFLRVDESIFSCLPVVRGKGNNVDCPRSSRQHSSASNKSFFIQNFSFFPHGLGDMQAVAMIQGSRHSRSGSQGWPWKNR